MRDFQFNFAGLIHRQLGGAGAGVTPAVFGFLPTTWVWVVPQGGNWKFVLWGIGGRGDIGFSGGAAGGYAEKTKSLPNAASVSIIVPSFLGDRSGITLVTFPDATTVQANGGNLLVGGTASGGDVNITGAAGKIAGTGNPGNGTSGGAGGGPTGGVAGGAGGTANLPFFGGQGGGGGGLPGIPGVGAGGADTSGAIGPAMVLAFLVS